MCIFVMLGYDPVCPIGEYGLATVFQITHSYRALMGERMILASIRVLIARCRSTHCLSLFNLCLDRYVLASDSTVTCPGRRLIDIGYTSTASFLRSVLNSVCTRVEPHFVRLRVCCSNPTTRGGVFVCASLFIRYKQSGRSTGRS